MKHTTQTLTVTVPLSFEGHAIAQECRRGISNSQKAKQVYLNTLAIYAVDVYLRFLGFATDRLNSDSRDPSMLQLMDVADLDIKNLGKLECRPVLPNTTSLTIPPEVWENRIGYVAVQLNQSLKEATILGFTQKATAEVPLSQLQSLETFLSYLSSIHQTEPINLLQWLEGMIETGWLAVEELLSPSQLAFERNLRDKKALEITRGKKIDLGMQLADDAVALIVTPRLSTDQEVFIQVKVRHINKTYLPQGISLTIVDEEGNRLETQSREKDNWIQLEFSAEPRNKFIISVCYEKINVSQEFMIEDPDLLS